MGVKIQIFTLPLPLPAGRQASRQGRGILRKDLPNPRTILKFDTGADGFKKMIYVLAFTAVAVLIAGIVFLVTTF